MDLDLFTTGGYPSSQTLVRSSLASLTAGASEDATSPEGGHDNLVRLLQIAISLDVPILPLSWAPAYDALGSGATSDISQDHLNSQVSFAFKRFRPDITGAASAADVRDRQYNAMAAEIAILADDDMVEHPNIITLQGICFEYVSELDEVRPVLVFPRAEAGDLARFVTSSGPLEPSDLLALCGEIAKAMRAMHLRGVVHGDLKPQNVLIYQDPESDAYGLKVADFGYSCHSAADDDLVLMPATTPWEAPEWHHRWFSVSDAKRMDVYSFGLLCLWLFFREAPLDHPTSGSCTIGMAFSGRDSAATNRLQSLKNQDLVLPYALQLLDREQGIPEDIRSSLQTVLELTICKDVGSRETSWVNLIPLLCSEDAITPMDLDPSPSRIRVPDWHGCLTLKKFLFPLDACDFRVHAGLVRCLASTAGGNGCTECVNNAAFQLSLCHFVGFGARPDHAQSQTWLQKSGRTQGDFEESLRRLKGACPSAQMMGTLIRMGYRSNLPEVYYNAGILPDAIVEYRAMIDGRRAALGDTHDSTLRLKGHLANMLRWNNDYEESANLQLQLRDSLSPSNTLDKANLELQVALIYQELGRLEDAESLLQGISDVHKRKPGEIDVIALTASTRLLSVKQQRGLNEEVIQIGPDVVQRCLDTYGPYHTDTLDAQNTLALALDSLGQLESSAKIGAEIVQARESSRGTQHPKTVEAIARLGVQYYSLGEVDRALECYNKIIAVSRESLEHAAPAVTVVGNYALGLPHRDEAITMLSALLPEAQRVLGAKHKAVELVMRNLAVLRHSSEHGD